MTPGDWAAAVASIALFVLWPVLVIACLNILGAPIPYTFKTWFAVTVLVMSVKAVKGRRESA